MILKLLVFVDAVEYGVRSFFIVSFHFFFTVSEISKQLKCNQISARYVYHCEISKVYLIPGKIIISSSSCSIRY